VPNHPPGAVVSFVARGHDERTTAHAYDPRLASSRQPAGIAMERERAMHLQMRAKAVNSPPDVELLLRRLKDDGVDLQAVGGSNVEFDGEIVIVPKDECEDQARTTLQRYNYPFREVLVVDDVGLDLCEVGDSVGGLHGCLKDVAQKNLERGRIIRDITVGVPDDDQRSRGVIPVHIFSEEVRTPASTEGTAPA
jgi:hypothetical protein